MSLRRTVTILSASLFATGSLVVAAPQTAKTPPAPAKGSGSAAAPAAGSGSDAGSGSAVAPIEDTPPSDMNGTDENPDAPHHAVGEQGDQVAVKATATAKPEGYPIAEAMRPITLPQNTSEVSISPHFEVSPYTGGDALRARYGITDKIQLGLTYLFGGVFGAVQMDGSFDKNYSFHAGKAVGLDLTVMLQPWLGVKAGVPLYLDPFAASLQLGAPIKFHFADGKFALGALDDIVNIKLSKFAPSYYLESLNVANATLVMSGTTANPAIVRISGYGVYQLDSNLALIGRVGFDDYIPAHSGGAAGGGTTSPTFVFLRAGIQWTWEKHPWLDVGGSLGFDDLSRAGSFAPQGYLALRI